MDHEVDLTLEVKQFLCKHKWVFDIFLVVDYKSTLLLNIRPHLFKDLVVLLIIAAEDIIKQMQLVERLLLKEGHDTIFLINHDASHVGDQGHDANIYNLFLGLCLKPKVRVFLLTFNGAINLEQILIAIVRSVPVRCKSPKFIPAVSKKGRLKLGNIIVQVRCALPKEATIASDRLLLTLFAEVHVDANGCLESITIDHLLVAIICNLVLDCTLQLSLQSDDNTVFKLELALLSQWVQKVTLYVVDVEVVKQSIQKHRKDGVVIPLLDELKQKILTNLAVQILGYHLLEVLLHDAFVHDVHLRAAVVGVTLLVDGRAAILEHFRVRNRCLLLL